MVTLRIRSLMWFSAGLVVALATLAGSLAWRASAAPGPSESTIVAVTPTRVLDTRNPLNIGLAGPFVSPVAQKLRITGQIPVSGGSATVVPVGATGVLLNVTVVGPTAAGFVSIRPGDASGAPTTSSLNFGPGVNVPNAVQVALPVGGANAGQIDIVYDASGVAGPTTELLIDVVGYTTNAGLQQLVADVATKANASDVFTKAESDARYPQGYSAVVTTSTPVSWGSGSLRSLDVACSPGLTPIGGGGSSTSSGGVVLTDSFPTPLGSASPTGWRVYLMNTSGTTTSSTTIRAHVLCVRIPGLAGADAATTAGETATPNDHAGDKSDE